MVSCDARLNQPIQEADLLHGLRLHDISIHLAFLFTWLACLVSFYLSLRHATNYTRPNEQKHILRILFMVPVFSVTAFLSIKFYELHVYLETAHQFYEAIVLAAFFLLLCHFLAPDLNTFKDTFTHVKPKPWIPRPKCLKKRRAAIEWNGPPKPATSWSKYINLVCLSIFQYTFVKLIVSIITLGTEAAGVFCAESNSLSYAHIYLNVTQTISLTVAMSILFHFYTQFRQSLGPYSPFLKFLAIKTVIGLSYMQEALFNTLAGSEKSPVQPTATISIQTLQVGLPNLILCFETMVFAILHLWAYPWRPYTVENIRARQLENGEKEGLEDPSSMIAPSHNPIPAFLDAMNISDILRAIFDCVRWLVVKQPEAT
ncbi:hypothetical protein MPH_00918 [Macrophomina phaseolina MS6]|uniref:Organic solute transporter Ost-alpha n=1 Tax=Macrophomina phaseolina (strain MS6) TaxID=1126212 RepID=K2SA31_MACPH|nr:hypothetical protein MPH_00918 [Macrophomina phaseolina MS6]